VIAGRQSIQGSANAPPQYLLAFPLVEDRSPGAVKSEFDVRDLLNLPNYSIYLKLMIDGVPGRAFGAETVQDVALANPQEPWSVTRDAAEQPLSMLHSGFFKFCSTQFVFGENRHADSDLLRREFENDTVIVPPAGRSRSNQKVWSAVSFHKPPVPQQMSLNSTPEKGFPPILVVPKMLPDAIGRSRGGRNTKIHAIADAKGRLLSILLTDGEAHDCAPAQRLIRRSKIAKKLLGDKAYDSEDLRLWLRRAAPTRSCPTPTETASIMAKRGTKITRRMPISTMRLILP
jgi:hypothetical protein